MQLSAQETKLVERLQRQQRNWPLTRWVLLFNGLLILAICLFALHIEIQRFQTISKLTNNLISQIGELPPEKMGKHIIDLLPTLQNRAIEIAIFCPLWLLFALFGLWHFTVVFVNWRGNPVQILLLKIVGDKIK